MPRLTVSLPEKTDKRLRELANNEEVSMTEVLRRALALYSYVRERTDEKEDGTEPLRLALLKQDDSAAMEIVFD